MEKSISQVVRGGQKIATVDVYDFIMKGKINDDIRLQEGDVIIVPPYEALVMYPASHLKKSYIQRQCIHTLFQEYATNATY